MHQYTDNPRIAARDKKRMIEIMEEMRSYLKHPDHQDCIDSEQENYEASLARLSIAEDILKDVWEQIGFSCDYKIHSI